MRTAEQNSSLGEGLTSSNATDISHHSCETHHYFLHCPWVSLWAIKYQHFFGPDRIHVSKVGCSWRSDGDKQCCWNTVSLCVLLILTRRSPASPKVALGLLSIARTRKRAVCHVSMANILASTSESNSYGWFMARIEPPPHRFPQPNCLKNCSRQHTSKQKRECDSRCWLRVTIWLDVCSLLIVL